MTKPSLAPKSLSQCNSTTKAYKNQLRSSLSQKTIKHQFTKNSECNAKTSIDVNPKDFVNELATGFKTVLQEFSHLENVTSIDRKLSAIIGLLSELKSILSHNTNESFVQQERMDLQNENKHINTSHNTIKSELCALLTSRKKVYQRMTRNHHIIEIYTENLQSEDPLIPKKFIERINAYDTPEIIEYKKMKSIKNLQNNIEMIKIYADGQRKTISNIDEKALNLHLNNSELEQLWKTTLNRDIVQIEKEWPNKAAFFNSPKHTMPISNMDLIHGNLLKNRMENNNSKFMKFNQPHLYENKIINRDPLTNQHHSFNKIENKFPSKHYNRQPALNLMNSTNRHTQFSDQHSQTRNKSSNFYDNSSTSNHKPYSFKRNFHECYKVSNNRFINRNSNISPTSSYADIVKHKSTNAFTKMPNHFLWNRSLTQGNK